MTESKIKLDFYMIKTTLYFINIIQNISYAQYLNNNRVKIEKYQPNIKKKKTRVTNSLRLVQQERASLSNKNLLISFYLLNSNILIEFCLL